MHRPSMPLPPVPHRQRGNALVMAIGIMVAVAGVVMISASQATDSLEATVKRSEQQEAMAALALVLDRYEARVVAIGNDDPTKLDFLDNFGIDHIGRCSVRWKIEPVRTSFMTDESDASSMEIPFIQNPRPSNPGNVQPEQGKELPNDSKWLFQISGEARTGDDEDDPASAAGRTRVMGARYVAVNKSPLFKYIIFYAQRGAKGDLELSHSGDIVINGNVHSNGAIYIGAAPRPLDKTATSGPNGYTAIGKFVVEWTDSSSDDNDIVDDFKIVYGADGRPVMDSTRRARVSGVDGIFRLSKPLMFAAINQFPMSIGTHPLIPDRNWAPTTIYDLSGTLFPDEAKLPLLGDYLAATSAGTIISPYRIKEQAGPIADAGAESDNSRTINGYPVRGAGFHWNDSRNHDEGSDGYAWGQDAIAPYAPDPITRMPRGFSGYARSRVNGGSYVRLPKIFSGGGSPPTNPGQVETMTPSRPLEPQQIAYFDTDGDVTTDNHEHARPLFLRSDRTTTTVFPSGGVPVEAPGTYLTYALGSGNLAMKRSRHPTDTSPDGSGWHIVVTGGSATPPDVTPTGLVIRERPAPDTAIWPGKNPGRPVDIVPQESPRFLPYAYGKHWYPSTMPFRVCDISDNLVRRASNAWLNINTAPGMNSTHYITGGTLVVTAANWPGNNRYDSNDAAPNRIHFDIPTETSTSLKRRYGGWDPDQNPDANGRPRPYSGTIAPSNTATNTEGYTRLPYFYRDNWKFVHLQDANAKPTAEVPTTIGLTRTVFDDDLNHQSNSFVTEVSEWAVSGSSVHSIGTDSFSTTNSAFNITKSEDSAGIAAPYSIRWEGYIVPPESGNYVFYGGPTTPWGGSVTTSINDGMRVWILDRQVASPNASTAAYRPLFPTVFPTPTSSAERHSWSQVSVTMVNDDLAKTGNASARNMSPPIALKSGLAYPIIIDHFRRSGSNGSLALSWKRPNQSNPEPIPASAFRIRSGDADGFALSTFKSIEAELDVASLRSDPGSQKAGLMIRGAAGIGPVLNGADPYISILFSPQRGIFTQYRLQRAGHVSTKTLKYYIGAGSGPNGAADIKGEVVDNSVTISNGMNRIATLQQESLSTIANEREYVPNRTYSPTNATFATSPKKFSPPLEHVSGGGHTYAILDSFTIGKYTGTITCTASKTYRVRNRITQILVLSNPSWPGFNDSWDGGDSARQLTVFPFPTSNSAPAFNTTILERQSTPRTDGRWTLLNNVDAPSNRRRIGRNYYLQWKNGTTKSATGAPTDFSIGDAGTIWTAQTSPTAGSLPRVTKNGVLLKPSVVSELQEIYETIKILTGITVSGTNAKSTNDVWNEAKSLADANAPMPLDSEVESIPDQTETPASIDFTTPLTFSYPRTAVTVMDVNSYVVGGGSASSAWISGSPQYLPSPNDPTNMWASLIAAAANGTQWPMTGGFRPDVWGWQTTAPPASVSSSRSPTVLVNGSANDWNSNAPGDTAMLPYVERGRGDDTGALAELQGNGKLKLWLRIENSLAAGKPLARLMYAIAEKRSDVSSASWRLVAEIPFDAASFARAPGDSKSKILAGACVQSGDFNKPCRAVFRGIQVDTGAEIVDASKWDQNLTPDIAKYLASQYQVFWGKWDITESFFNYAWNEAIKSGGPCTFSSTTDQLCANEEWFYHSREFWSQRRFWEHLDASDNLVEKDPGADTFSSTRVRQLLAKTTVLRLNMRAIQRYLRDTSLTAAVQKVLVGQSVDTKDIVDYRLIQHFNGLIYAARTNRYPWNPFASANAADSGINPWSAAAGYPLPNSGTPTAIINAERRLNGVNLNVLATQHAPPISIDSARAMHDGVHRLQPYAVPDVIPAAPPCKPEDFHHGVMVSNAADIDWGFEANAIATFGASKTAIVTPNALYLHGDLNTVKHIVQDGEEQFEKPSPLVVMGDSVTLLSSSWAPSSMQAEGLIAANVSGPDSIAGNGTLAVVEEDYGPTAGSTSYMTALVTNNLPCTRERVMEGQSAPFIDSLLLMENWYRGKAKLAFYGSLVVMDSRRYSRAFLLDQPKTHGTTPFGFARAPAADVKWQEFFANLSPRDPRRPRSQNAPDWIGASPQVYALPFTQEFSFNDDLSTAAGTPPFTPFGITATGVGSWVRVVQ